MTPAPLYTLRPCAMRVALYVWQHSTCTTDIPIHGWGKRMIEAGVLKKRTYPIATRVLKDTGWLYESHGAWFLRRYHLVRGVELPGDDLELADVLQCSEDVDSYVARRDLHALRLINDAADIIDCRIVAIEAVWQSWPGRDEAPFEAALQSLARAGVIRLVRDRSGKSARWSGVRGELVRDVFVPDPLVADNARAAINDLLSRAQLETLINEAIEEHTAD